MIGSKTRQWTIAMAVVAGVTAGNALAPSGPAQAAPIGTAAPAFSVQDQSGATVDLSDFLGTGVILDFCTVWCAVCQTFYSTVYPVVPGKDLILPMVMENGAGSASTQSIAQAWSSLFGVPQVAHMSGNETLKTDILNDYLSDLGSIAFPTFVFIDANLDVVGNIVGVRAANDAEWVSYVDLIVASRTQVPEPAIWGLLSVGLFGSWLARRGSRGR
ncbi:redoxin domain-containing protein [Futiania mangrovi]|uniref:Redoxin domain-containing protein n=1 Tax=Futiania mangrovi TaxID=2959716 RepID=A0A9J6PGE4_9PROT|nr:redoxin domain-containing protein [Futiania mangrovii]MCP1337809.1 redoxin domain-containing protein [Futiania mangrovii]